MFNIRILTSLHQLTKLKDHRTINSLIQNYGEGVERDY